MSQKLSELLEQCESDNSAVCLSAKRRLRYHAAEVLPGLLDKATRMLRGYKGDHFIHAKDDCPCIMHLLQLAIADAEEVKDRSEHWDFNDQETFQP